MKKSISTQQAPAPLARYSQAVKAGNTIYVSAMLGQDPQTGQLITADIKAETTQVLENIKMILKEAGADFSDAVKCSIFLRDINNYEHVNEVYGKYVTAPFPARETIGVSGLPMNVNIEIAVIAVLEQTGKNGEIICDQCGIIL
jgi:2-iminobutanoate/2-iminopropanoate deaminase